jgi:hypothetical protein
MRTPKRRARRLGEFLQCRHGRIVNDCPECPCRRCKIDPVVDRKTEDSSAPKLRACQG